MNDLKKTISTVDWADLDDVAAAGWRLFVQVFIKGEIITPKSADESPEPWEIDEHDVFGSLVVFHLGYCRMAVPDVDAYLRRKADALLEAWDSYGRMVSQQDPVLAGEHY